ncbi:methionine gamma-lyase family protein [Bacillus licheniformis]|nr:methionine gamma-lyase family protein [Bacillus licheniformis]
MVGVRGEENSGSLKDFQIGYSHVELTEEGAVDLTGWQLPSRRRQRSSESSAQRIRRPSVFTIDEIEKMIRFVKEINETSSFRRQLLRRICRRA